MIENQVHRVKKSGLDCIYIRVYFPEDEEKQRIAVFGPASPKSSMIFSKSKAGLFHG